MGFANSSGHGALSGLRVLDCATLAAGPLAAAYLSELGAEVIKVEQPGSGDPIRGWGSQKNGVGLMWKSVGRNKQSVSLNLRVERGRQLLIDLASNSDVIIMNTRPGTLRRWDLTYQRLAERNRGLVMLHVTGFGGGGPASDRPGFGTLGEAMSGFAHSTGQADGPPTLPSFMLADGVASLAAAYGVLAALYNRDVNGGQGQVVDVSLIEPLARLLEQSILDYDQLGLVARRFGNRWQISVPRNCYQTRDNLWIVLSGSAPRVVERVYRAIGRPDLIDDEQFGDAQNRLKHADEIDTLVAEWIARHTQEEAMTVFIREEVAAAPVYSVADLMNDEHLSARGTFVRVDDPDLQSVTVQGSVVRLSETPGEVRFLGRSVGEDNAHVYGRLLGLSHAELEQLAREGVI